MPQGGARLGRFGVGVGPGPGVGVGPGVGPGVGSGPLVYVVYSLYCVLGCIVLVLCCHGVVCCVFPLSLGLALPCLALPCLAFAFDSPVLPLEAVVRTQVSSMLCFAFIAVPSETHT